MEVVVAMLLAMVIWSFVLAWYLRSCRVEKEGALYRIKGGKNSGRYVALSNDGLTIVRLEDLTVRPRGETYLDAELLAHLAKRPPMTAAEREEQRRSFAYGNVSISNPNVTRELVDQVADENQ